jgi:hypothetical protein
MTNNFEHLDYAILSFREEYKIGDIIPHFYDEGELIESPAIIIAYATEKEWIEQCIKRIGINPREECPWILETHKYFYKVVAE